MMSFPYGVEGGRGLVVVVAAVVVTVVVVVGRLLVVGAAVELLTGRSVGATVVTSVTAVVTVVAAVVTVVAAVCSEAEPLRRVPAIWLLHLPL